VAFHRALNGFFGVGTRPPPRGERARALLEREKALVLRSIKELEFDHQMGKVGEADFVDLGGRLRARALALMQDIDRAGPETELNESVRGDRKPPPSARGVCAQCGTANDADAKFCKQCGHKLEKRA
jgi:hypothetical protein